MDDKSVDIVNKVLEAAGRAGTKGFEYMVHYQIVGGIVGVVGGLAIIGFVAYTLRLLFNWKPEKSFDDDMKHLARAALIFACFVIIAACINRVFCSVTQILAPEGAAIQSALR